MFTCQRAGIRIPLVWPLSPLSCLECSTGLTLEGRAAVQTVLSICRAVVEETALGATWRKHPQKVSKKNQGLHPEHLPQLGYPERVLDSKAEGLFKFLTLQCPSVGPLGPSINPRFLIYPMRVTPTSLKNRRDPGFPACQW